MSVGTISVGNESLAKNIGSFLRSFAGTLGITATSGENSARELGVSLAKPFLNLFGGRLNEIKLRNIIDNDFRINNPSIKFFENNKFNKDLFLPNAQRPVLDEAYREGVADQLRAIAIQGDKDTTLNSIASDLVAKLKARGLFAHAGNDDSGLINLVNIPFNNTSSPGLDVSESGRPGLFFDSAELANATIHQRQDLNGRGELPTTVVKNIFDFAVRNNKISEVLQALNRFIDLQFLKPDRPY